METKKISAVILAGGKDDTLQTLLGISYWALAPIKDKPMIQYVIEATKGSGIEDIIIVGEWTPESGEYQGCRTLKGFERHVDNVEVGLRAAKEKTVLILAGDIPAITVEVIQDFLKKASITSAVYFPISLIFDCELKFPEMKRTSLGLREGTVTAGNIFLVPKDLFLGKLWKIRPLLENKKSKIKLAWQFGLVISLLTLISIKTGIRLLSLETLEKRASQMLGIPVRAIWADPSIASDIDTIEQYEMFISNNL
ncbi:MAG: NTP transferase domain-containing protein [Patescibacteria group bacterium]